MTLGCHWAASLGCLRVVSGFLGCLKVASGFLGCLRVASGLPLDCLRVAVVVICIDLELHGASTHTSLTLLTPSKYSWPCSSYK